MKIDARLNEEASGGGDQQPPWDPNNPPFWWNPNTPLPPDYPNQYPQDLNGDGVISIIEWLAWVDDVSRAWREVGGEDNPNPSPDDYGDDPYGVAPWIDRGGLPSHIAHNPWWLLPPRGGQYDETHPMYQLYLYYINNYELTDLLFVGVPSWAVDILLALLGFDGDPFDISFENFLALLRFFWRPHIPSRLGQIPGIGGILLKLRELMLNNVMGIADLFELFGFLNAAGDTFYSVQSVDKPGNPDLDGDGIPDDGIWFRVDDTWYWVPAGELNPTVGENPLDVPEVIDRPPQPEMTPPPDPFQFDPPGAGPITPLAQVEGEFAKAFARYNKGMNGKGIR